MTWHVEYTKAALKQLKKMDCFDAKLILGWIEKNLEGCENPRVHGKGLTANRSGEWRYRVGNYRILCVLEDNKLIVEVFSVGHRSEIYKSRQLNTGLEIAVKAGNWYYEKSLKGARDGVLRCKQELHGGY